ncbi:30S ribosomal protein S1 [Dellaglioa sp. P0083]|uniref:30S ribosomal protein S1 n=1 Tax=Dellaglioa kimchii TaxID=3344667 RepID=UPI0038D42D9B
MSNIEENNDLLEALNSVSEVKVGSVIKGEVLAIDDAKQVIVGIEGAGVEGVVPAKELALKAGEETEDVVKIGDVMDLVVISSIGGDKEGGSYLLSQRRIAEREVWNDLQKLADDDATIEAIVTQVVKGGLVADAGVRGFVPASMIDDRFVEDLSKYNHQTLDFKIIEIDPTENRLILSHKAIVKAQRDAQKVETLKTLTVGEVVTGTVARLTNFGAFVDLGGIDGLVHISEISYNRISKAEDVLSVGEEVKVKVLAIDLDKNRISLSIKQTLPQPWDNVENDIHVDDVLDGTVKRLTTFGAFVEVMPGIEGLVHISQISYTHIATPGEVLKTGQAVQVKVLEVHPAEHRLALSIKALEEKPATEEKPEKKKTVKKAAPKAKAPKSTMSGMPEESTGFTLGDILGKALEDADTNK